MKIAFMDYETTDLPKWSLPSDHESQPYMVSAAIIICKGPIKISQYYELIQSPVESEPKAFECHNLTKQKLDEDGVDKVEATKSIVGMVQDCDYLCAHNVGFDKRMLRIAAPRTRRTETTKSEKRIPQT